MASFITKVTMDSTKTWRQCWLHLEGTGLRQLFQVSLIQRRPRLKDEWRPSFQQQIGVTYVVQNDTLRVSHLPCLEGCWTSCFLWLGFCLWELVVLWFLDTPCLFFLPTGLCRMMRYDFTRCIIIRNWKRLFVMVVAVFKFSREEKLV